MGAYERNSFSCDPCGRVAFNDRIPRGVDAVVIEGKPPLILEANRMDEIDAALVLAHDYNLKLMIVGGAEAWLSADRLAAAQIPVLTGAIEPSRQDLLIERYKPKPK